MADDEEETGINQGGGRFGRLLRLRKEVGPYSQARGRTGFDGGQARQESDGVQDAFLPLETAGFQNPGRDGVDDEGVKEEPGKPRKVVVAPRRILLLIAHGVVVVCCVRALLSCVIFER